MPLDDMKNESSCSFSLDLSEMVIPECKNSEETEELMVSISSKDAFNYGFLVESVRMESRP